MGRKPRTSNGRLGNSNRLRRLLHAQAGVTASEYAVLFGLLVVSVLVSINTLGMSITGSFTNIQGNLSALMNPSRKGPESNQGPTNARSGRHRGDDRQGLLGRAVFDHEKHADHDR